MYEGSVEGLDHPIGHSWSKLEFLNTFVRYRGSWGTMAIYQDKSLCLEFLGHRGFTAFPGPDEEDQTQGHHRQGRHGFPATAGSFQTLQASFDGVDWHLRLPALHGMPLLHVVDGPAVVRRHFQ